MRVSSILRQAADSVVKTGKKKYRAMALTVSFKHPDFDMKEYEILSRASAFLLSVDPPEDHFLENSDDNYSSLELAEQRRKIKEFQREHGYSPATPGGKMMDMSWLEFAPREYRPQIHVIGSSHVYAPFLWKDYYPQDWLSHVSNEHCQYALEVYDEPGEPLMRFDMAPRAFHHPEGRDLALAHFANEKEALPKLKKLGVEFLHLRDDNRVYKEGETLYFEGFAITDDPHARPQPQTQASAQATADKKDESEEKKDGSNDEKEEEEDEELENEDLRVFYPHNETGKLAFHQEERFYATTPAPLPEGLCGGPVLDEKGRVSGVVEGIVPPDHPNAMVAGSAAFMPHLVVAPFVEFVERQMLRSMFSDELFQTVVTAKKTNSIGGGVFKLQEDGSYGPGTDWDEARGSMLNNLKKQCSKEEYEALLKVVEEEKKEINRIMQQEGGGDYTEIADRVRARTMAVRDMVVKRYKDSQQQQHGDDSKS